MKSIENQCLNEWAKMAAKKLDCLDLWEDYTPISTEYLLQYQKRSAEQKLDGPSAEKRKKITTGKYQFSELVDISLIDKLLHECHAITGVANALLDNDNTILSAVGWLDICTKFHRTCPHTEKRCRQSDSYIFSHIEGGAINYKCLNGLFDYAVPIIVEGQKLAAVYMGQFLHEPPDIEFFRQQARECGFDETAYLKALEQVPIIPKEKLKKIMKFYSQLVQVFTNMGLERIRQLEAAEDKFFKAFHCCPDPITISTLEEGCLIDVNEAWEEISGYERHENIGNTGTALGLCMTPEEREMIAKKIYKNGSIRNFEIRFRAKSGEVKIFLLSAEILDVYGKPHLLCVHKDITDRKRMEQELRISEECFSKAFNASPMIMCITTLDEDSMFIDVNDSFCHVLDITREEVLGRFSSEVGIWLDNNNLHLVHSMIIKKQAVRDMEIHFKTNSQEQRLGLYSAERIDIAGKACILSILNDITESRQMEIEMNRLDRLNLVGEMAASIGHEIRNPMTTVRGFLQIFKNKDDYKEDIDTFRLMIDELDRANAIITEYLSLAKHKLVKLRVTNLNQIINNMLPLFQVHALPQDKIIQLQLGKISRLMLDEKEIRQLLLNMVHNGLEAMLPGGTLTIRTAMKDQYIILSIEDQGEGIPTEAIDKLGTPFFSTKEQGTGLGLAVCYGIAKRHNAYIDVESSPQGTTFYVKFLNMI